MLALESMGKADNATSDVAVEGDGNIYIDEGLVFRLDTVTPDCEDDMWVYDDGPSSFEGRGFAF